MDQWQTNGNIVSTKVGESLNSTYVAISSFARCRNLPDPYSWKSHLMRGRPVFSASALSGQIPKGVFRIQNQYDKRGMPNIGCVPTRIC